ncbi:MAG: PASTA domain-containing protein [Balneolaceae bacterium]|nr:PASTA domain-containing protein [Balneolaceae bacterium]
MNERTAILSRMFVVFGLLLLIPCAIILQLLRINFWEGDALRDLWSDQAIDEISIPAQRGNIYDNDGSLLVTNSVAYKVAIDPHVPGITSAQISEVCATLAKHSRYSANHFLRKIRSAPSRSRYVVLDKNIPVTAYEALQSLDIRAVILEEEYQRRNSFGSLAAHTLGYVNHTMNGQTGLEKQYNETLKGTDGLQQVRRDRSGRIFAYLGAPKKQPEQGHSLYTTIDSHIQAILEEELKAGVDRTESNYGTAIVMDPRTGAIKALANYPTFNPNNPSSLNETNRRNFMISDMIEPGSTFKLVTAIAAVEQGKVRFDETFETPDDGKIQIHGQWMRDHDPLGTLTFPEVIEKSSNVASAQIAMRLDKDTFYQYARNLGFGTPTNVDLPSEEPGRLQKPYEWSMVTLPWMSIGYEVQVTPIQMAQAYAAFANDGKMIRPYLVEKIVDEHGSIVQQHEPIEVRQVAEKETIRKLQPVFQRVVSDSGTAAQAQVEGLSIVGKTGTAQKLINGRYRHEYRGMFVGFFPADNPRYLCLVMMDQPQTWPPYGGWVAGPVFKHTAKRIAGLDNAIERQIINHDQNDTTWAYVPDLRGLKTEEAKAMLSNQKLVFETIGSGNWVKSQSPEAGTKFQPNQEITITLADALVKQTENTESAIIPDVDGMSMRKAVWLINKQGFEAKMIGSGTVHTQFPRAGDSMKKGRTITLRGKAKSLEVIAGK